MDYLDDLDLMDDLDYTSNPLPCPDRPASPVRPDSPHIEGKIDDHHTRYLPLKYSKNQIFKKP